MGCRMLTSIEHERYRATFQNMKCKVHGENQILKCKLEIELRRVPYTNGMYQIYYVASGRPLSGRACHLACAKQRVCLLFQEQLTPWAPYSPPLAPAPSSPAAPRTR